MLCLFFSFLSFFHFLITACLLDCQCRGQQLSKYYFRDRFFRVLNCSHSFTDACEFRMNGLISSTDTIKQRLIPFLEGKKIKHIELKELCCKSAWHWPSERSFFSSKKNVISEWLIFSFCPFVNGDDEMTHAKLKTKLHGDRECQRVEIRINEW